MTTITRIATLQRSLRELGRIRMGDQVPDDKSRTGFRPRKLATFRLTSASRDYLEAAAEAYGGTVTPWQSARGQEYQLTIAAPALDVLVPPGNAVSQAYELWSGGGCQRRCDGLRQETGDPCACPSDPAERTELAAKGEACKPTTRLWVILPRLPDLGRWRLEAHGYYAAVELAGMAEIASMATSRGIMLQARLRIDQRTRKIPGKPTRNYIVPVLELPDTRFASLVESGFIPTTAAQLADGQTPAASVPQLEAGRPKRAERPALGPAPEIPDASDFGRPTPAAPMAPVVPPSAPLAAPEIEADMDTTAQDSAAPRPSEAICGWRLGQGQGKPALRCGQPAGHSNTPNHHDWEPIAMTAGGRVIRPDAT